MMDLLLLGGLWFFTAGVSGILYLLNQWAGGLYWFLMWDCVTVIVALWELYIYLKYKMTLTKLLEKAGTDKPKVMKHKWMARLVILSYMIGGILFAIHLWPS